MSLRGAPAIQQEVRHGGAFHRLRALVHQHEDLTAPRDALAALGVSPASIEVDHGLTGTNRERPGLREAMAACREGDTLVVTELDRLARSLPDARSIADELTARQGKLNIGGSVDDPNDAVGRLLFNVFATAELADLYGVGRSTVYRAKQRHLAATRA